MSRTKEPCGCTHDGARWLSECEPHKAEEDAHHARALAEHRAARNPQRQAGIPDQAPALVDWLELPTSPTMEAT
jgi:hypothetical protein